VCIALPGGIGTLDEVFTVAPSATIGYHTKKVILYNMKGFWDTTIALSTDLEARGFIRGRWTDYILCGPRPRRGQATAGTALTEHGAARH
jgi:predicted Rossmann-fold nucleotide-binding protein